MTSESKDMLVMLMASVIVFLLVLCCVKAHAEDVGGIDSRVTQG